MCVSKMPILVQIKLIISFFLFPPLSVLQEFMEALQSSVSVSFPPDLSSLHGVYDLSVLPHGLLASHHNLVLHPHLTAGNTQVEELTYTHRAYTYSK